MVLITLITPFLALWRSSESTLPWSPNSTPITAAPFLKASQNAYPEGRESWIVLYLLRYRSDSLCHLWWWACGWVHGKKGWYSVEGFRDAELYHSICAEKRKQINGGYKAVKELQGYILKSDRCEKWKQVIIGSYSCSTSGWGRQIPG